MLYLLLALVSLVLTAGSVYQYMQTANFLWMVLAFIFLIATVALGGFFMSGRVNKNSDIHITE
ncbi:MAG: hypothetical protein QUS14_15270 [Pyrinomonadaceae bacterium]|nr:hypothetical protein [Pyrinomonadaceae bacterium]